MAAPVEPAACTESLEAFEAFAVGLQSILGGGEAVPEALALLLRCFGGCPAKAAAAGARPLDAVLGWCIAEPFEGPAGMARALLAKTAVLESSDVDAAAGAPLLAAAPAALAAAPAPVAADLADALAGAVGEAATAAAWLKTLRDGWDASSSDVTHAYAHAAKALLARHPAVAEEAWEFAGLVMLGPEAGQRRLCMQELLPPLVAASEGAAARLDAFVRRLAAGSSRAEVADALHLTTEFLEPLLEHWRLASLKGDHEEVGASLAAAALRFGLKEYQAMRKEARFVLQRTVQVALTEASEEEVVRVAGCSRAELGLAWRSYWELFDSIEDYSSHLLKSSWEQLIGRMVAFLGKLPPGAFPPAVFSPHWLEVFLSRAFAHDNDSVQRFVLGEVLKLDSQAVQLSEAFVLEELLPRFSHSIDSLYPKSDVTQTFEAQVIHFFSGFVQRHERGPAWGAQRLLLAVLKLRAVHHTPLRLVLSALLEVKAPGALSAAETLDVFEFFFSEILTKMPVSVRQLLVSAFLDLLVRLASAVDKEEAPALAGRLAQALSAVPDNLLVSLQGRLAAVVRGVIGEGAPQVLVEHLRVLTSSQLDKCPTHSSPDCSQPMVAAMVTFGLLRGVWACSTEQPCAKLVWPALAPALTDFHLRTYLPQHVAVSVVLGCVYAASLLPDGQQTIADHADVRKGLLAYVESRASVALLQDSSGKDEATWLWLYALVLEKLWQLGEPSGDTIAERSLAVLRSHATGGEAPPDVVLSCVAATSLLGAVAPKRQGKAEAFLALWRAQLPKPQGITDARFLVSTSEGQGAWSRNRLEEHEDLHRMEREGLGRVLEWRDTTSVFLVAKWRALARLACDTEIHSSLSSSDGEPWSLGLAILDELETLQPPHVAFWASVARRVAYPLVFHAGTPAELQRSALQSMCRGLRGAISEGTGDGSTYMPRGCLAELAAALCDPQMCRAEHALFPGSARDGACKPLTESVKLLLATGEVSVGISRGVAVPLLASLLRPWSSDAASAPPEFAELLVALLFHNEGAIIDGALCHSPALAAGIVDGEGPGSEGALDSVCPESGVLAKKFGSTRGLPRILTLSALDALAERAAGGPSPPLIVAILERVFAVLQETLDSLLSPSAGKNKPPTPMPTSAKHRTQLRGWQTALVLGYHADKGLASTLLPTLFRHLQVPHVPDVRDFQELLGCVLCSRFEDLAVEPLLIPALQKFDSNVQVSASLLIISGYLFRRWVKSGEPPRDRVSALVRATAPYLSHNAAYVRGVAAWGFYEMFSSLGVEGLAALGVGEPVFGELYRFLVENKECQKMRGRLKPVFEDFDPDARSALSCLLDRSIVRPEAAATASALAVEDALHVFTDSEFHPMQTFLDLLKDEIADEVAGLWDRADPTQYLSSSESWHEMLLQAAVQARGVADVAGNDPGTGEADANTEGAAGGVSGLQRKFCPEPALAVPGSQSSRGPRRRRAPLRVVATLVDKVQNLGGLCRTCEVFACQSMSIANIKMAKDQTFQSISVTAEKWLPINEVPRAAMREHLLGLRRKGYALVGVEQTHNSVPLDQWKFAPNTVIVLGAEKEGIDGDLLPIMDACVEIPQFGQLRSLNVHVSASLVIWEYIRQRRNAPEGELLSLS